MKEKDIKRLKNFGQHLSTLRKERGLSMRELAARCDVDYAKISKIERNKANLTLTTLIELAEGLDISPSELVNIKFD